MPIFRRRKRKELTERRSYLMQVAAEEYEDGDTPAKLRNKVKARIEADGTARPFLDFLMKLFEKLLPLLLNLLSGTGT